MFLLPGQTAYPEQEKKVALLKRYFGICRRSKSISKPNQYYQTEQQQQMQSKKPVSKAAPVSVNGGESTSGPNAKFRVTWLPRYKLLHDAIVYKVDVIIL
jgi:hypothetical protein